MDDQKLKSVHAAAQQFLKAIEAATGNPAIVCWGSFEDKTVASGATLGEELDNYDIEKFCFILTGRLYNIVDYGDLDDKDE
jgi:hypothetical protein